MSLVNKKMETISTEEIAMELFSPNQTKITNIMKALSLTEVAWTPISNELGQEEYKPYTAMTITGSNRKELVEILMTLLKQV